MSAKTPRRTLSAGTSLGSKYVKIEKADFNRSASGLLGWESPLQLVDDGLKLWREARSYSRETFKVFLGGRL